MSAVLDRLAATWSPMRIIRLAFGLLLGVEAIKQQDWAIGAISAFFLYQAITDTGCCSSASTCAPQVRKGNNHTDEIEFEEIK